MRRLLQALALIALLVPATAMAQRVKMLERAAHA